MSSRLSTQRLARVSAEHPWRIVGLWGLILVASAAIIVSLLGDALSTDQTFVNTPEALTAQRQIDDLGIEDTIVEQVVLTVEQGSLREPARLAAADRLAAQIQGLGAEVVARVVPPSAQPQTLVSASGRAATMPITMAGDLNTVYENVPKVLALTRSFDGSQGIDAKVTGVASINEAVNRQSEKDLQTGEIFGIGTGLIILLVVFGALVAALVPLMLAIVAIVVALALTALAGQFGELSFFVTNMITMMGLAVGIDYALFIVSRYREERSAGVPKLDAIERAGATSSRAVFFSGLTVVVALAGLLIVPMSIFISLGLGAILVALAAVAAALTLLPAVLSLLGDRIDRLRLRLPRFLRRTRNDSQGVWARLVAVVMRSPKTAFIVTAGVLMLASIPYWGIQTGASGVTTLPPTTDARIAFETLDREFSVGGVSAIRIPALGSQSERDPQIATIRAAASTIPALGEVRVVPGIDPNAGALIEIPLLADGAGKPAADIVRQIRGATTLPVGGATAFNVDYYDVADRYLPVVVALVLTFSFIVLLLAFRSIVAPLLAIVLNLLSVGAAFGLLTLVCQNGFAADLLGYQQVGTIEAWLPIFLFAVLFGLSMDYHVFLLSRIRERFLETGNNRLAIEYGITSSARLITGAALIMVAVFAGFSAGKLVMFQQMGFGLGVAILLDATLVRGILVPAAMRILGPWNWYLPSWLSWLPEVSIEGPSRRGSSGSDGAAAT